MRLLVACPQCKRQFDAGGRAIGGRFRCYCGATVTVRQPQGHDATVVRCSSCGAPRAEGATACKYCGADFTLHEQDLDTVCPQCFARVSDRAKFCHHCGVALRPETLGGEKTELCCPACGKASCLSHRKVGSVALMECQRCAGFWLGASVLEDLVERASHGVAVEDFRLHGPQSAADGGGGAGQSGRLYRQCPACGAMMNRVNYARRSGVIIDVCREHGVWFDADELSRILVWVREGGKAEADRQTAHDAAHQERLDAIAKQFQRRREAAAGGGLAEPDDTSPNILVVLGEIALELFGGGRWRRW